MFTHNNFKKEIANKVVRKIMKILYFRFLTNSAKDFDSRKWAAEGLSYLTLDADAKEELCRDTEALHALFELAKSKDKTVMYGVVSCLVNCTNTYDKNDDVVPEMIELAKYAKHHIPEQDEKVSVDVALLLEFEYSSRASYCQSYCRCWFYLSETSSRC